MSAALDAGIHRVLDILVPQIQSLQTTSPGPIVVGITGLQGSGKSTWATRLVSLLHSSHSLHAIAISLDDLYKTHHGLVQQRDKDPTNKIYRSRGQPGTHDEDLAARFFKSLRSHDGNGSLPVPSFDKSRFNGQGDRAPRADWPVVTRKPDVVVFEGWCLGFRPLSPADLERKWQLAKKGQLPANTPANHDLAHLLEVNANLANYCDAFMGPRHFDFLVHIDTADLRNVYKWRLEQEHKMIATKGTGMSDELVRAFIDGYMPGYELYLDQLREGFFDAAREEQKGRQVRVLLDGDRAIVGIEAI